MKRIIFKFLYIVARTEIILSLCFGMISPPASPLRYAQGKTPTDTLALALAVNNSTQLPSMKLPWEANETWYLISGPHNNFGGVGGDGLNVGCSNGWMCPTPWSALDFAPSDQNGCQVSGLWVTAAWSGKAHRTGNNEVEIDHDEDGNLGTGYVITYEHLDSTSTDNYVPSGRPIHVNSGDRIGHPSCNGGIAYATHLHFAIKLDGEFINIGGTTLSGWLVNQSTHYNGTMTKGGVTKTADTTFTENNSLVSDNYKCPSSGPNEIILYKSVNYSCDGEKEGIGYVRLSLFDSAVLHGWPISLPANFGASSIAIPPGWHVTLNTSTGEALRCQSDDSFYNDMFWGFPLGMLNDNIRTIEVHGGSCTNNFPPNAPPNNPTLSSPPSESNQSSSISQSKATSAGRLTLIAPTAAIKTAPYLTWKNMGDPNGDEVRFFVEVIGNNQAVNSGWINNLVWRPSILDYQYGNYQWHVKARDGRGAESNWSEMWSFSIQSPNKIPSISFSSANGNTFPTGIIYTRSTNWSFNGTASDPEGLNRVEWRCTGDNYGTTTSHSGLASWSHTQTNMSGRNEIYFVVYDTTVNGYTNNISSRRLILNIDLAAPTTTPGLNGQSNSAQWPAWFTNPVEVNLHGVDNGTGHAVVGMGKVHYQVDGGGWQVVSASDARFTVSGDGSHTVDYYSEDALGNTETMRSLTFQIDATPPTLPVNLQETHGVSNNQWQNGQGIPGFVWDAASDNLSGVRGYQLYFGDDPNGIGLKNITASQPRAWSPFPAGVPTGTYYLRVRTQDVAGNWSGWATLFTYRFDNTPPENPSNVSHSSGASSAVWQSITSVGNFSWPPAHDAGAGLEGYYVYWGPQADGTSDTFITASAFDDPLALCDTACTGYLRARSLDKAGNLAEDWNTIFVLRYDNVPPAADFTFNGGATATAQTRVDLLVNASDEGSGVHAVQFSFDGVTWLDWEQLSARRPWNLPAISRVYWPTYVQVKDQVGLLSPVVMHEIYLDVNPEQPSSLNYRLFTQQVSGGSGSYDSANYSGHGTVSQVSDAPLSSSPHFTLWSGYEAGSQANPLNVPGHEDYTFKDGVFASGTVGESMQSDHYQLILSSGSFGLSSGTAVGSPNYQHQPGFLVNYQPPTPTEEPPIEPGDVTQPPMPPPDPVSAPDCDASSVLINNGETYTDHANVSLSLCSPFAVEMMISAQENFAGASWEPFSTVKSWTLSSSGSTVEPRFVYVQYRDNEGQIQATYFDDILFDPNRPQGALLATDDIPLPEASQNGPTLLAAATEPDLPINLDGSVTLFIDSFDDNSGVTEMQISASADFPDEEWHPFSPVVDYTPEGDDGLKTVYARFRDEAGNISGSTEISFLYDRLPPEGYIYAEPYVLPGDASTVTLYLGEYIPWEEDETDPPAYVGDAVEMRLGAEPSLADAPWQPLVESITLPIDPSQPEGTFYAQYRDAAGNTSEIVDASYQIDTSAPELSAYAEPGTGNDRTIYIYAYDDLAGVANLYLSNDPLMEADVVTQDYTDTLTWTFDDQKVLWIVAEDGVGNKSEPYPVYATDLPVTQVSISGNAGMAGATITYDGGSTLADETGSYSFSVDSGWTGTVVPSLEGYSFSPESITYDTGVTENLTAQDFVAAPAPTMPSVILSAFTAHWSGINVTVDWSTTAEINNSEFRLFRSTDTLIWTEITTIHSSRPCGNYTSTSPVNYAYTDTAVIAGGTYYYRLQFSGAGCGGGSVMSAEMASVSPAPGLFGKSSPANHAVDQPQSLTITWGTSTNVASYEYCYDTTDDDACLLWVDNGTSTSKNLTGLAAGETYYWHVRAVNAQGEAYSDGAESGYWFFTTIENPPTAFTKSSPVFGAQNQPLNPSLTWTSSVGAADYQYCYDKTNDDTCNSWITAGTNTSANLVGLDPSTAYYWQVRATNNGGTTYANVGTWWTFVTVPEQPAPFGKSAPTNGAVDQLTLPTLSWGASTGAVSYEYCYDTTDDNACSVWTDNDASTSISLSGLSKGVTYYWHVRAVNAGGITYADGASTVFWSFTTLPNPPATFEKNSPTDGAINQSTSPTLIWDSSTGAASYEYCFDETNNPTCEGTWTSTGTNSSVGLSGLSSGSTYYWQVRAINSGGATYANFGDLWSFSTIPPAPEEFDKLTPLNGAVNLSTSPILTWETSVGADSYEYCYDTTDDGTCSSWTDIGTSTSKALSGLTPGITYYWHVRAINAGDTVYANGTATAFWSFTTLPNPPAAFGKISPTNGVTDQTTSPTLTWSASTGAASYEYCYDTTDDDACSLWIDNGTSTSKALSGLASGVTYYWHVRAVNAGGTTYANTDTWWSFTTIPDTPPTFSLFLPLVLR